MTDSRALFAARAFNSSNRVQPRRRCLNESNFGKSLFRVIVIQHLAASPQPMPVGGCDTGLKIN
ncbi:MULTISPECIES: hypothetical protein [unclassified Rhizobium]|uniref:hypothetical protein n=1 Tax=unclassified Rhizobium TaxID=2613769 RepID=UPI0012F50E53|nr:MULTISPECIES: hypothetical protein [unclassified Rhizobium]MDK4735241.1 hypothetical protein [Rhizobium sp. CNPSo 3490]